MAFLNDDEIENQIGKLTKKKKGKSKSEIGRGAKRKGKIGERNIVDFLKDLTKLSWIRIPNSGAFTGNKNRERAKYLATDQLIASIADIFPPDQLSYQVLIESKFYKNFSFNTIFKKKQFNANLTKWCKELLYDCITYAMYSKSEKNMLPLLWIKINGSGEWILYNRGYFNKLFNTQITLDECFPTYLEKDFDDISDLKLLGFDDKWVFCKAHEFVTKNKEILFRQIEI
jgi:hypothetical protein